MEPIGIDARDALEALAGWALRGGALLMLVTLAAWAARRRSASLRHGLWAAAVAAHLILPLAASTLPRWPVAMFPPLPESAAPRVAGGDAAPGAAVVDEAARPAGVAMVPPGHPAPLVSDLPRALLMLWLLGTVLLLARRAGAEVRVRRWVAAARSIADLPRKRALSAAAACLGVRAPVRLLESERVTVPLVCGGRRPAILLPPASSTWDAATLRAVLLHELAHVRRRDVGWHLVAHLVRALFWFDPLAWLAVYRMRVEAEQAADDTVLAAGERPSGYAGTLLDLATAATLPAPAVGLSLIGRSGLGARIEGILGLRDRRPPGRREMVAGALALAAIVAVLAAVEPGPSAAPSVRAAPSRAARFENEPGAPVRILAAEVQVVPAVRGRAGDVRLTRPRLKLESLETGRRISALQLNLETPGLSDDRLWEEVDLGPGKVIDVRLAERIWSQQAPASLAARVRLGVSAVRFEDGSSWSGRGAGPPRPPARKAGEETPAPEPSLASPAPMSAPSTARPPSTPEPSSAPPAPDAPRTLPAPPGGSGGHRAPTPRAQIDRARPPGEPVFYRDARFQNPAGAPLIVENARTPVFAGTGRGLTALPIVTFRNTTDRRITSVRLRFKAGSDAHAVTVLRSPIEPHGTLVYRRDDFELEGDPARVAIQVIGVGFEDGTSWGTLSSSIDTREEWIYPLESPGRP